MSLVDSFLCVMWIICALCGQHLIDASNLRPETELAEAVMRLFSFRDKLFGSCFTEHDENLFAMGSQLDDVNLALDEIIPKYGYALEKYEVTTEDGYILTLFRIPSSGRPLLLMHGLMMSADEWVTPGLENGIAYLLANEGYDIWLGNVRGNKHARRHLYLSPDSAEFWNFSWDEMGRYDLPAIIDFILNTTGYSQLVYIGYSQGTTTFFVMGSERPEYNDKISLMVAMAPISAVSNIKSPFLVLLKHGSLKVPHKIFGVLRRMGFNEFNVSNEILDIFVKTAFRKSEIVKAICSNVVTLAGGFSCSEMNVTNFPIMLSHMTSGASMKQLEHYAQTAIFQRFQKYSYGADHNKQVYGSVTPQEYDIRMITTPLVVFYGPDDWLASVADVEILLGKLKNVIDVYKVPEEHFNHLDYFVGKHVKNIIHPKLVNIINRLP